jgi:putative Holliday junction resolvase
MKILGIDYGERRIGVAMSDPSGRFATGTDDGGAEEPQRIWRPSWPLWSSQDIERIVVGYPLRLDGTEGIQCEKVRRFADRLRRVCSRPVELWDETLSTKEAEAILRQTGVRRERRRDVIDRVAAAVILQDYLDGPDLRKAGCQGKSRPPETGPEAMGTKRRGRWKTAATLLAAVVILGGAALAGYAFLPVRDEGAQALLVEILGGPVSCRPWRSSIRPGS